MYPKSIKSPNKGSCVARTTYAYKLSTQLNITTLFSSCLLILLLSGYFLNIWVLFGMLWLPHYISLNTIFTHNLSRSGIVMVTCIIGITSILSHKFLPDKNRLSITQPLKNVDLHAEWLAWMAFILSSGMDFMYAHMIFTRSLA